MGAALGSGGYLTGLERTMSGGFSVGKCLKMDDLTEIMKK
jgi:tRNA U55 pseudouridine synthase TruB